MPRKKTWLDRRPIASCQLGVLHAFGPGAVQAPNHMLEFRGSEGAGGRRLRVPLRGLKLVCLYGSVRVTVGAVRLITDAGAALAYMSSSGLKTNGVLQPTTDAWKGRRYRQFQAFQNPAWTLPLARRVVSDKMLSQEEVLLYTRRQGRADRRAAAFLSELPAMRAAVDAGGSHAILLGLEGMASKRWFEAFGALLPQGWTMPGRRKRPPTDPVNALLSLGYTLLFHRVQAACQAWGLDPSLGFFHQYRPGRASLACDLMEPFRVPAVDRLVLQKLAIKRYNQSDFVHDKKSGSVSMTEDAFKRWLGDLETHLHACDEGRPSLHVLIVERVHELIDALPPSTLPYVDDDDDDDSERQSPNDVAATEDDDAESGIDAGEGPDRVH
jgi:CRISP-associated protein Cas1